AELIGAAYACALEAMEGFVATRVEAWRSEGGRRAALRAVAPMSARSEEAGVAADLALGMAAEMAPAPAAPPPPLELGPDDPRYRPQAPQLDLFRAPTLSARPDGRAVGPADPFAERAGTALTPVMARAQETTLAGMRLLDPGGVVVGGQAEIGLSFAHVDEVAAALSGTYAARLRYRLLEGAPPELASISRGTGVRVFVAFPVEREGRVWGVVYLSRTPKSILKHLYGEREKVVLAAGLVLGLAAGLAMLTSRTISRPVEALLGRMRAVMAGDGAAMAPLARPGTREIAELSAGISRMAAALAERADTVRAFARHVSHEFKTPLAGIRGASEILEDHDATLTPAERQRFIGNIARDAARLEALLARLLDLARAEHAAPPPGVLALGPALEAAAARAGERARVALASPRRRDETGGVATVEGRAERGRPDGPFAVSVDVSPGLDARITSEALGILVDNLARNAAEHGARRLRVIARPAPGGRGEGARIRLVFADDGRGISPANRARIFEQFFTTRRPEGGTGLGLSIVRTLLASQGGTIALADSEPGGGGAGGASFVVTLRG
ncbi:MAG: ATP-binding protein, partial [Pseudomonadota bacterium]